MTEYTGERPELTEEEMHAIAWTLLKQYFRSTREGEVVDWGDVPLLHQDQYERLIKIIRAFLDDFTRLSYVQVDGEQLLESIR